jgi:glycosyltransferase involved in cell wall biosynthesis
LVGGKYALMVSANRFEKNAYRCFLAFERLFSHGQLKDYRVVVTGAVPKAIRRRLAHAERYVFLGYVQAGELEALYADCDFFVYGSLNEGFGLPPLEALKYGKTCLVSGVASLPEVYGDSVYYFSPTDINEIVNRLLMAASMKIDQTTIGRRVKWLREKIENDSERMVDLICSSR